MENPADKIILALDGMEKAEAFSMVSKLSGLKWVKVGLELFVSSGPEIISNFREDGLKVFLDLKFHDIPVTMSAACRKAAGFGAELITVHGCAGRKALEQANRAAIEGASLVGLPPPRLLVVTVLTSWEGKDIKDQLLINQSIQSRVQLFAKLSSELGLGGCICSPKEVRGLRSLCPLPFELVTPGVRLEGDPLNDQARVMTPSEAINEGASKLVIGRSITQALNPEDAFSKCCNQLERV
ncbi:orotidine-5'-phosphate decarboxylase [Prochlorococcus sp. MIT 1300]|uniref:orotidine-5'-phosphate decarboxylase n=1 Tax=Prochlorococcus sp. MIT 1300 TaxID=3096218 RepID=UPI002A74DAC4|nr:orotidine-5'-phosphate decarboxylase [Prochlorococcus sp. MIT 1300]